MAQDFLAADLIDKFEFYVVPVILGDGIALFRRSDELHTLRLTESNRYKNGIVSLIYVRAS